MDFDPDRFSSEEELDALARSKWGLRYVLFLSVIGLVAVGFLLLVL